MTTPPTQTRPYQQAVHDVLLAFRTDPRQGLSHGEAHSHRERHGRNELTADKPTPAWRKFFRRSRIRLSSYCWQQRQFRPDCGR
jgi:Ca2+-transporting ATPase